MLDVFEIVYNTNARKILFISTFSLIQLRQTKRMDETGYTKTLEINEFQAFFCFRPTLKFTVFPHIKVSNSGVFFEYSELLTRGSLKH
jgi:hypothetical protein